MPVAVDIQWTTKREEELAFEVHNFDLSVDWRNVSKLEAKNRVVDWAEDTTFLSVDWPNAEKDTEVIAAIISLATGRNVGGER